MIVEYDELVRQARSLVPDLADRAAEDRDTTRIPTATMTDLRQSDLLRVLTPTRNGGLEADLRTHLDVVAVLAEGCPSTAWVVGVIHAHCWLLGHFEPRAQDEVHDPDSDPVIAGVLAPRGAAVATEGGFRLSGAWPFGSGVEHAEWIMLGANTDEGPLLTLLPANDVEVADDWNASGLRATGSCTRFSTGSRRRPAAPCSKRQCSVKSTDCACR